MEINETIYEYVVEPSCKENTNTIEDANHPGRSMHTRGVDASSKTHSDMGNDLLISSKGM